MKNMITKKEAKERLEYLRGELRAERISSHEIYELEYLALHIEPGDVELLEAAGIPEVTIDKFKDQKYVRSFGSKMF